MHCTLQPLCLICGSVKAWVFPSGISRMTIKISHACVMKGGFKVLKNCSPRKTWLLSSVNKLPLVVDKPILFLSFLLYLIWLCLSPLFLPLLNRITHTNSGAAYIFTQTHAHTKHSNKVLFDANTLNTKNNKHTGTWLQGKCLGTYSVAYLSIQLDCKIIPW